MQTHSSAVSPAQENPSESVASSPKSPEAHEPHEAHTLAHRTSVGRILLTSLPMASVHIAALGVFFVDFSWKLPLFAVALYGIRMFGITGAYHRYFSHRSYKTSRFFQFCLSFLGSLASQKGALWWAAHHRHHHRFSDQKQDIHSPIQDGFWWSHIGWIISDRYENTRWDLIKDLARYPELVLLDRYWYLVQAAVMGGVFYFGGLPYLFWYLLSTAVLWHGTFTINSLAHVFGSQRYETGDTSRNNFLLALITLGEGWHNNHHCYQRATRNGFYWWEIDLTYYGLKFLEFLGLIWDLHAPPLEALEKKRIGTSRAGASLTSEDALGVAAEKA